MMTENSRNMQPRDTILLYNKCLCLTDIKVLCINIQNVNHVNTMSRGLVEINANFKRNLLPQHSK